MAISVNTVKSGAEISKLFDSGKRIHTAYLTLIYAPTSNQNEGIKQHDLNGRVAFIAGKKNGNAVWRNKAKRRMRAICSEIGGPWQGYDVVFLAKKRITEESYSKILSCCQKSISNQDLGNSNV